MLWRDLRAWQVYGANTDVGKTIISTILCKALARRSSKDGLLYLKPVSTGPQNEADDRHLKRYVPGILSRCISQFAEPVSPHLAASQFKSSQQVLKSDVDITNQVKAVLSKHSERGGRYALVETAGGVLSPAPSGSLQADLYRPLRLPVILIGDSKLGGIGGTISAFESLRLRGYDTESVVLFDDPKWGNHEFLQQHFAKFNIQAFGLPPPPPKQNDEKDDEMMLSQYYDECADSPTINKLISHLHQNHFARISKLTSMSSHADSVIWHPFRQHNLPQNIIAIDAACGDHFDTYNLETDVAVNTSEDATSNGLTPLTVSRPQPELLTPMFDASASWWTQGLGHGNPELSLTAAYAAGRYGHVMFASAVHEPALDLSYNLLETLQNPRLSRVFFTDNGSTGMEVAVKMALRATCQRYGWDKADTTQPVGIIGLKGSYHGDTIGVMNCSEPSTFNEKVDWYRPWGHWFEPPEVKFKQGQWHIELPPSMSSSSLSSSLSSSSSSLLSNPKSTTYSSLQSIFDYSGRSSEAALYKAFITRTLTDLTQNQKQRFGALILEPIIMGAGGMIFVDPLFQRTLITTIRENPSLIAPEHDHNRPLESSSPFSDDSNLVWSGLPFIADEVFTGLYRLGRPSSTSYLNSNPASTTKPQQPPTRATNDNHHHPLDLDISPDISVHAKLLTGGLLPLALTAASPSIFNTFLSDSKADALLHGHSYTAHPIGCAVANKSLQEMKQMSNNDPTWQSYRNSWSSSQSSSNNKLDHSDIFSFYDPKTLVQLSNHTRVASCFALGTVMALTLRSREGQTGYSSNAAASLQAKLSVTLDEDGVAVHSRVLGDVIYFMTSLITKPDSVRRLERSILAALDDDR